MDAVLVKNDTTVPVSDLSGVAGSVHLSTLPLPEVCRAQTVESPQRVAHRPRVRRGRVARDDLNGTSHEIHQSRPAGLHRSHTAHQRHGLPASSSRSWIFVLPDRRRVSVGSGSPGTDEAGPAGWHSPTMRLQQPKPPVAMQDVPAATSAAPRQNVCVLSALTPDSRPRRVELDQCRLDKVFSHVPIAAHEVRRPAEVPPPGGDEGHELVRPALVAQHTPIRPLVCILPTTKRSA